LLTLISDKDIVSQSPMKGKAHNMNCIFCQSTAKKNGKDINGNQRYRCNTCAKTFSDQQDKPLGKMYLPIEKAAVCIALLMEGTSLRSVQRLTGIDLNTLMKLLVLVGEKCERFLDSRIQNVPVDDVECDELWCFVQMKEKTLKERVKHMDNIEWEEVEKLERFSIVFTYSHLVLARISAVLKTE
jgi:transposase-like protein